MRAFKLFLFYSAIYFQSNAQFVLDNDVSLKSQGENIFAVSTFPGFLLEKTGQISKGGFQLLNNDIVTLFSLAQGGLRLNSETNILFSNQLQEFARFNANGNLGIGTKIPMAKFHLAGDAIITGNIAMNPSSTISWDHGIKAIFDNGTNLVIASSLENGIVMASDQFLHLISKEQTRLTSNGLLTMVLDSAQVGIGTEFPQQKLTVIGDIGLSGEISAASDSRMKEEILPLDNALGKIRRLRPVTYKYKVHDFAEMNFPNNQKMGLLAQEVQKVLPDLVTQKFRSEEKQEDFLGVNYLELIPLLIKANQELDQDLSQLKVELASIQKELITLKNLLNK